MTTTAPRHGTPGTDERTRVAWTVYRDSLRDLRGDDYDAAEREAWEALQRELSSIASTATREPQVG
jgi:hypothetical protein